MIHLSTIPVSTATEQELLVEIEEQVCRPFCVSSSVHPIATATFTTGSVTILNGNAIVPLIATVVVTAPEAQCGCAHTQVFTEQVNVAFNAGTTNVPTLAAGASSTTTPTNIHCGKARGIKLTTTLTITLA